MFESLTQKFQDAFKKIRGRGRLTEDDVKATLREIRMILLEADVNLAVVKGFVAGVSERAVGHEVMESLSPGQQVIKIVHEELVRLLGGSERPDLELRGDPAVVMLLGLQGSGKTTTAGKLALWLRRKGRKPMLVPADIHRPAAEEQLRVLAGQIAIPFHEMGGAKGVVQVAKDALAESGRRNCDTLIVDTAGRLHIDEKMVQELVDLVAAVPPDERLLVLDSTTGQDAVRIAEEFTAKVGVDGFILTKLDGDTKGGAALSVRAVTGKPIKFTGIGEKLDQLDVYYPDRMAQRILGLGDTLSLIEKAQEVYDAKRAVELEKKVREETFDLEDFLEQFQNLKKMGPLESLVQMIPGIGRLGLQNVETDEKELARAQAIIQSMTKQERRHPEILDGSRRRRVAAGSGTRVQDVNELLAQFNQVRKMMSGMLGATKKRRKGKKGEKGEKVIRFPFKP
jgi:signal recognition particle subunit SRP54